MEKRVLAQVKYFILEKLSSMPFVTTNIINISNITKSIFKLPLPYNILVTLTIHSFEPPQDSSAAATELWQKAISAGR